MSDRGNPHHEPESLGPIDPGIAGLHLPLDEHAGPARALPPAALRAMVASAVDAWPGPELHEPHAPEPTSPGAPQEPPTPPTSPAGLAIKPFLLGAAVATTACLATVATMLWLTGEAPHGAPADAANTAVDTSTDGTATEDTAVEGTAIEGTASEGTASEGTAVEDTAVEGTAVEGTAVEGTAVEGTAVEGTAVEGTAVEGTASEGTASEDDATDDATSGAASEAAGSEAVTRRSRSADARVAEDLLERANRLRGAGSFREADAVYERVTREHRGAFAAYVAEVASASLHLEQLGDPRGAAQRFERALRMRPGGALDLEALDGLARARRALGDREGERDALRTLLSRHPASAAAARATTRLADLEPRPPSR
jgi:hypothetical protein